MLQRVEGAAIEQVGFDIVEFAFDFALGLRPADAAGLGAEAVVGGEGEELGIVEGAVGVVAQDHRFEVVVQADAGDAAEMMEGLHVLAQRGRQIHRLDEAQVLPARVAEQVAEQVDAPPAFAGEVDVVDAMIHLGLHAGVGLKARHGRRRSARPQQTQGVDARPCSSPLKPRACSSCTARSTVRFGYLASSSFRIGSYGSMMLPARRGLGKGVAWPSRWACRLANTRVARRSARRPRPSAMARCDVPLDAAARSHDASLRS